MKKIMRTSVGFILAICMLFSVVACGGNSNKVDPITNNGNSDKNKNQYTIRLSHANPTTTFNHDNVMHWKSLVEKYTDGNVRVEVFSSGQLMGVDEELPAILEGNIEAAYIHGMIGENITDEYLIWGIPVVFGVGVDSMDNILDFVNTDLYKELVSNDFEAAGYKAYVAYADVDHGIFTVDKRIDKLSDLSGLRIRSHGGGFANDFIRSLGSSPMTITSPEVPTALMQGTVDGMETGKIYADKSAFPNIKYFYECASDYAGCGNAVILSLDFYNKLPAEYQAALDRAGAELTIWAKDEAVSRNDESLDNLKEKGLVITKITDEDAVAMFKSFYPTLEKAMAKNEELAKLFWYAYENYSPYDFGISK